MLSEYFKAKTSQEEFKKHLKNLLKRLKDKKVIIYGAGEAFVELNKLYKIIEKLDIVAIADKNTTKKVENLKIIAPEEIANFEFDKILISTEKTEPIESFLTTELEIESEKIEIIFKDEFPDERINFNYIRNLKFKKRLEKLNKKLKDKKIVVHGAGAYFKAIKKYYDLSNLNIIAISDRSFISHEEDEEFLGYKVIAPNEIKGLEPDCVLVATKFFIGIIEDLYDNALNGTKIEISPLVKKPFFRLLKELWG